MFDQTFVFKSRSVGFKLTSPLVTNWHAHWNHTFGILFLHFLELHFLFWVQNNTPNKWVANDDIGTTNLLAKHLCWAKVLLENFRCVWVSSKYLPPIRPRTCSWFAWTTACLGTTVLFARCVNDLCAGVAATFGLQTLRRVDFAVFALIGVYVHSDVFSDWCRLGPRKECLQMVAFVFTPTLSIVVVLARLQDACAGMVWVDSTFGPDFIGRVKFLVLFRVRPYVVQS